MSFIKLTDLDLAGKRVLIRADLNVPVKDGKVTSDARITASMPTSAMSPARAGLSTNAKLRPAPMRLVRRHATRLSSWSSVTATKSGSAAILPPPAPRP